MVSKSELLKLLKEALQGWDEATRTNWERFDAIDDQDRIKSICAQLGLKDIV